MFAAALRLSSNGQANLSVSRESGSLANGGDGKRTGQSVTVAVSAKKS